MGQLTNLYVSQSYQGLLKLANSTTGVTGTLQYVQDGVGNNIPMLVSTSSVVISGSFYGDGSNLTGITANVSTSSLVTTSSFNAYTSSNDAKWTALGNQSGSWITESETGSFATTADLTSLSSSVATTDLNQNNRLNSIESVTGSLQNQINQKLDTGSFNTYTSSNDAKVNALINATGSYASTSSLTSLSQSIASTDLGQDNRLGSLESATSSLQNQINQKLNTGSFNSYTSSNDARVTSLESKTGSYATTGSNDFIGQQNINGSVNVTGSLNVTAEITALSASITYLKTIYQTSSIIFTSGSNILGDEAGDTQTLYGTVKLPNGPLSVTGSGTISGNLNVATSFTASGLNYPSADNGVYSFVQTDGAGNLSLQYVKTLYQNIRNMETSSIAIGTPLFVSGSTGDNANVYIADASNPNRMPATLVAGDATLAPSATGKGIILGHIQGVDTTGYPAGTEVFVAPGGGWTSTRPTGSATPVQPLGIVTREGTNGMGIVLTVPPLNLPNITTGNVWVGNGNSYPIQIATSSLSVASAVSASQAQNAVSASHSVNSDSSISSSFATNALSASHSDYSENSGLLSGTGSGVFATTGSNIFKGTEDISGSLNMVPNSVLTLQTGSRMAVIGTATGNPGAIGFFENESTTRSFNMQAQPGGNGTVAFSDFPSNNHFMFYNLPLHWIQFEAPLTSTGSGNAIDVLYGMNIGMNQTSSDMGLKVTGSLFERGTMFVQSNNTSLNPTNYLTSSQSGQSNIVLGWGDNPGASGASSNQANYSGSLRITGSNNIVALPQIRATGFSLGSDLQGYLSGSNNIINGNNAGIFLNTGSLLFPKTTGNWVANQSYIAMNFTTSSLAGGHPIVQSNTLYGGAITINSNSGSITSLAANLVNGSNLTSTQNFVTNVRPTISTNIIGGAVTLNHISSSINYQNNINNSAITVNNHLSSSNITNNSLTISNNMVLGGSSSTGLSVWVSGSQNTNVTRNIIDNLIGGKNIVVSSSFVSSSNSNLVSSLIYGNGLTVSGSHTAGTNGGSTFLGRFNGLNGLEYSQDVVFAVGTGTSAAARRTGFWIDSGSFTNVSGAFNTIGNATVSGSLNVSGSAVITGSVQGNVNNLTVVSNTASMNLNNGNFFVLQLTGSQDIRIEPSNIKPGQTINIKLNTTGSGTVSFPSSVKQISGSAYVPTTTTSTDIITMVSFDGSDLFLANVKNLI